MDTLTPAADGDNSSIRLVKMPLELLVKITSHLTTPEYGSLRFTCKIVEAALFEEFSKEFFTKRQFVFTEFSLQALVDISKSRMSSCLNHVIFSLERPSLRYFPTIGSQRNSPVKDNLMFQGCLEHLSLINTGQDVEMLAEAFSNLAGLEIIGIRDFNSRSRYRDHPQIEWTAYGAPTFKRETGNRLQRVRRFQSFNSPDALDQANYHGHVFLALLRALGKADSRPKNFEVILRESSLYDQTFYLPSYVDHIVQPVLHNLRTLFLDLNSDFPAAQVDVDNVAVRCPSYLLRKFLSRVPQLEHLRINFESHQQNESNHFISWLSESVSSVTSNCTSRTSLLKAPQPIDFNNLRQLDIGMTATESQILLGLIRKYRATLQAISLHKVCLLPDSSTKPGWKVNIWAKFFSQVSKLDLNLASINMSFLSQQSNGNGTKQLVTFRDSRDAAVKKWAGTDVQSGLRDFADLVQVRWPEHVSESNQCDENDEDHSDVSMNSDEDDSD